MRVLWQDLRFGARMLAKNPGFTAVAVLTLALGIGANTAMFGVVNSVLLRQLPYPEPERLVAIFEKRPAENNMTNPVSPADFFDWRGQSQSFESMAAWSGDVFNLLEGEAVRITGAIVSPNFFDVVGVKPRLGTGFTAEHEVRGKHHAVILADGLWQRRFGADPALIGKTINIGGNLWTVVGVLPASFQLPHGEFELFLPYAPRADERDNRGSHFLSVIARLKPGVSHQAARAEMGRISALLEEQHPKLNRGHSANVIEMHESLVGKLRPALETLMGAVVLVLLIACANLTNLLLARATTRHREMAVRMAMGAGRMRVVRQLLTESVLLACLAGGVGVLVAINAVWLLGLIVPPEGPGAMLGRVPFDGRVLAFTAAVSVLSGILFGLAPALRLFRDSLTRTLAGRTPGNVVGRDVMRKLLVVSQLALSLMLLVGAGLLLRSFDVLRKTDPGFRAEHVLTFHLALPFQSYADDQRKIAFLGEVLARLRAVPGVKHAGVTSHLPASGTDSRGGFVVEGVEPEPGVPRRAHFRVVSPGYFEALQTRLKQGRLFTDRDTRDAPRVIIVNEAAARYWPDGNVVGKRARFSWIEPFHEVVGIVENTRHWGLDVEPKPEAYLCNLQTPFWSNFVAVTTAGDPLAIANTARGIVRGLDPQIPVAAMHTMEDVVSRSLSGRRFPMMLLAAFAALALLLAATGVFGVMNYLVMQRTQEIGVRIALGATRADIVRDVFAPSVALIGAGVAAGTLGAFALAAVLRAHVYGISVRDPITFAAVPVILFIIAATAVAVPARRAASVDPVVALRHE